jgi:uncharacterized protein (DUF2132 family)
MPLPPDDTSPAPAPAPAQPRNPLHGVTLEAMLSALVDFYGWQELSRRIALRCFVDQPTINSSLKMLRKTPWAREKVEGLYLYSVREQNRQDRAAGRSAG